MVDSALCVSPSVSVVSGHGEGQDGAVGHVGDTTLARNSRLPIRVLALLAAGDAGPELDPLKVAACASASEFNARLDNGDFDIAVFDVGLGGGWPVDTATALCDRLAARSLPLVLLFEHSADAVVVEGNILNRDVWCIIKNALQPGDLPTIVAGLAKLARAQERNRKHN
jgi:hypothetical protein